jgi:hypothetical protein
MRTVPPLRHSAPNATPAPSPDQRRRFAPPSRSADRRRAARRLSRQADAHLRRQYFECAKHFRTLLMPEKVEPAKHRRSRPRSANRPLSAARPRQLAKRCGDALIIFHGMRTAVPVRWGRRTLAQHRKGMHISKAAIAFASTETMPGHRSERIKSVPRRRISMPSPHRGVEDPIRSWIRSTPRARSAPKKGKCCEEARAGGGFARPHPWGRLNPGQKLCRAARLCRSILEEISVLSRVEELAHPD